MQIRREKSKASMKEAALVNHAVLAGLEPDFFPSPVYPDYEERQQQKTGYVGYSSRAIEGLNFLEGGSFPLKPIFFLKMPSLFLIDYAKKRSMPNTLIPFFMSSSMRLIFTSSVSNSI